MTKLEWPQQQMDINFWAAAILSAILAIVGRTKLIFKLEPEFDTSNPYMKKG